MTCKSGSKVKMKMIVNHHASKKFQYKVPCAISNQQFCVLFLYQFTNNHHLGKMVHVIHRVIEIFTLEMLPIILSAI